MNVKEAYDGGSNSCPHLLISVVNSGCLGETEKPKKDEEAARRGEDAVLLGVNDNMYHLWLPVAIRV